MRSLLRVERPSTNANLHPQSPHVENAGPCSGYEMLELRPWLMVALMHAARRSQRVGSVVRAAMGLMGRIGVPYVGALTEAGSFVEECFGEFDFRGIRLTLPTTTFEGKLSLTVGDKRVELIQVGPAHTKGDVVVHLPAERVVFTGDILFIGSHPIAWEGPVQQWIAACDLLLDLDAEVIVPGHGPLTTKAGVRDTKAYWEQVVARATQGRAAGASPEEVARDLLGDGFAERTEAHRLVVNVDTIYRDLAGDRSHRDPLTMFALMARLERADREASSVRGRATQAEVGARAYHG